MLYRSKNDADNSVNDPIGGPDEINRKDRLILGVRSQTESRPLQVRIVRLPL